MRRSRQPSMVHLALTGKNRTFGQRLFSNALLWGIPMLAAELIGVLKNLWVWVVILVAPATAVGVLVWILMEYRSSRRRATEITTEEPINHR